MPQIPCSFNLFQEGRTYTGHHRNYILENAIKTCYAPETREKIRLREALGYLGHGRRELAGRLALPEVSAIKMADGTACITENVPSNVTTAFEVNKDGMVTHTQEILETAPGKIISGLNASKVGGFSWACGGVDGGAGGRTRITDFHGFDYVMNPGFATNRGYILESADAATHNMILENISKSAGLSVNESERWLKHWQTMAIMEGADLRLQVVQTEGYADHLRRELESKDALLEQATKNLSLMESAEESRRKMITEAAKSSVVAVPKNVLEAMISLANEDDFYRLTAFFEAAGRINMAGLPLVNGQSRAQLPVKPPQRTRRDAEYGSALAAVEF